nr:hypothetical protein [Tanacetum cinerariifolium]
QVQHQREMLVAHMQEGFRTADFSEFDGYRQFEVIVVGRHQAQMAGAYAEAVFAIADRAQVNVEREVHEVGEAHLIAVDA